MQRASITEPIGSFKDVEKVLRVVSSSLQNKIVRAPAIPRDADGLEGDIVTFYDSVPTLNRDVRKAFIKIAGKWKQMILADDAIMLAGSNLTEITTTSTTAVDLISAGVNIQPKIPILVLCNVRKTTGAANNCLLGMKLNATQVVPNFVVFNTGNANASGLMRVLVGSRVDGNHLNPVDGRVMSSDGIIAEMYSNANVPQAVITSVTITGYTLNASITLATDDLRIYTFPV